MRDIKQIQFVGISPIIGGEARQLLAPQAKGIEKIEVTSTVVNISMTSGELVVVPVASAVITYKMENAVAVPNAFAAVKKKS